MDEGLDFDVIVIGAGLAGVGAALRVVRPDVVGPPPASVCLIEGTRPGGVLNWRSYTILGTRFRFKKTDWALLADDLTKLAIPIFDEDVVSTDLRGEVKVVRTASRVLRATCVIIASGAFQVRNATSYRQNDGMLTIFAGPGIESRVKRAMTLMRKRSLVLIGTAQVTQLADVLAELAPTMLVEPPLPPSFQLPSGVHVGRLLRLEGKGALRGVTYEDAQGSAHTIECDAVIYDFNAYMGCTSATSYLQDSGLELVDGFIPVDREMKTALPGVFAAGDVTGGYFGTTKSMHEGSVAAFSALRHIGKTYYGFAGNYFAFYQGDYRSDFRQFRLPSGSHITSADRQGKAVFVFHGANESMELDVEDEMTPLLRWLTGRTGAIDLDLLVREAALEWGRAYAAALALVQAGVLEMGS